MCSWYQYTLSNASCSRVWVEECEEEFSASPVGCYEGRGEDRA